MTWTLPGPCSLSELGDTGGTRGIGSTGGAKGIRVTWGLALQRSMCALPQCPRPHIALQMCQLSVCGPRRAQSLGPACTACCACKHATCMCTHTQSHLLPSVSLLQHCDTVTSDTQGHMCVLAHPLPGHAVGGTHGCSCSSTLTSALLLTHSCAQTATSTHAWIDWCHTFCGCSGWWHQHS